MADVSVIQYADDGTGTLLDPIPRALVAPEATNQCKQSRTLNSWTVVTTASVDYDIPGIDGATGKGSRLTDSSDSVTQRRAIYVSSVPTATDTILSFKVWLARTSGATSFPGIQVNLGTIRSHVNVNTNTGIATFRNNNIGTDLTTDVIGDWFVITWQMLNPDGAVSATFYIDPAVIASTAPPDSNSDVTQQGSCGVGQAEAYFNVPASIVRYLPPIYTTTVPVLRDKDEIILDNLNLNAEEGSIYFELLAGQDTTNLLNGFLSMTSGVVEADDGTNQASSAEVVVVGSASKVGMIWGPDGMQQCTDGVWSPLVPYAGSLNDGVLDLFRNAEASNQMRELQFWNTAEKATIDSLMGS